MSDFGVKVKLTVDKSNKKAFNEQINSMVDQIKVSKHFTIDKGDISRIAKDIQSELNKENINITSIKVEKIDCSAAVKDLQNQLQSMINSLSIKNGVKIEGLVDPTGTGKIGTQIDNIADAATRGQAEVNRLNAQMSVLKTTMSTLKAAFNTITPGRKNASFVGMAGEDLNAIIAKYTELLSKMEAAERARKAGTPGAAGATEGELSELQREILLLQERIDKINQTRIAKENEVAASIKASAVEKKTTKEKISAENQYADLIEKVNNAINKARQNLADWTKAKQGKSSASYKGIADELEKLELLSLKLSTQNISLDKAAKDFNKSSVAIRNYSADIKYAHENTRTFAERVGGLAAKFSSWLSVSQVVTAVYRAMKQMVTVVVEVDTAMTELKKVTDETETSYAKFLATAATRAKGLGATLTDTITATADFARLGYNLEEASSLADAALVYKNVGDGIEDIATASESVIATMQAFGVQAENAMSIVDKFNAVGNKFAISSGGIGDALLRSAAAMQSANNTLDETIALTAAANTIVQDPEKVGKYMPNNTVMY